MVSLKLEFIGVGPRLKQVTGIGAFRVLGSSQSWRIFDPLNFGWRIDRRFLHSRCGASKNSIGKGKENCTMEKSERPLSCHIGSAIGYRTFDVVRDVHHAAIVYT